MCIRDSLKSESGREVGDGGGALRYSAFPILRTSPLFRQCPIGDVSQQSQHFNFPTYLTNNFVQPCLLVTLDETKDDELMPHNHPTWKIYSFVTTGSDPEKWISNNLNLNRNMGMTSSQSSTDGGGRQEILNEVSMTKILSSLLYICLHRTITIVMSLKLINQTH